MIYKFKDIIEEVDEFNSELKYGLDDIVGVTIEKGLIPTVANLSQTNLDKFYLVKKNTFVYNPRTHGVRLGMGFNETDKIFITSWNNVAFKVKTEHIVLPKYLWMFFNRPEWDRQSNYLAWGSSTIVFAWKDFLEISIDLPPLEEQRSIVSRYKAIETRIANNKQTIAKLEEAAQALYRKMFVDDVDVENLPDGWRMGCLGEVIKLGGGGTPSTANPEYWNSNDIAFYSPGDRTEEYFVLTTEKFISKLGLEKCSSKLYPLYTTFVTARGATTGRLAMAGNPMAMNQTCYAILSKNNNPFYIHQLSIEVMAKLKNAAVGAVFEALTTKDFDSVDIIIPNQEIIDSFESKVKNIYESILLSQKENEKLTEMLSLMA